MEGQKVSSAFVTRVAAIVSHLMIRLLCRLLVGRIDKLTSIDSFYKTLSIDRLNHFIDLGITLSLKFQHSALQ